MTDFVKASHVFLHNSATTAEEALQFVANAAKDLDLTDDAQGVLDALLARENEGSTGMSEGFAIPHAKSAAVKTPSVIVLKSDAGIAWDTMDDKAVKVAIALLVPDTDASTKHLQLLSQVAVMLMDHDFCDAVLGSQNVEEIAQIINNHLN